MLLAMKMQITEEVQSPLGYLGRNENNFLPQGDKQQAGEIQQHSSRSCLHPLFRMFRIIIILIQFLTETVISLLLI